MPCDPKNPLRRVAQCKLRLLAPETMPRIAGSLRACLAWIPTRIVPAHRRATGLTAGVPRHKILPEGRSTEPARKRDGWDDGEGLRRRPTGLLTHASRPPPLFACPWTPGNSTSHTQLSEADSGRIRTPSSTHQAISTNASASGHASCEVEGLWRLDGTVPARWRAGEARADDAHAEDCEDQDADRGGREV